jgi:hypothetical protein
MNISVIAVTARAGGFDILVHCMMAQTFPQSDFEVIVVDSFYDERNQFVKDRLPANFRHVKLEAEKDYYDACYANNFGLRLAQGELIVHFCDQNWAYENCLADHWRIYQDYPGYSLSAYCDRYPIPKMKQAEIVGDEHHFYWNEIAWTCYEEEMTPERAQYIFNSMEPTYRERKGNAGTDYKDGLKEIPGEFFYASLNESIPMSVLKEINGWNENLDGGYGSADIDLGVRANIVGWKFLCDPNSINRKFGQQGTSHLFLGKQKQRLREPADNYKLFQENIAAIRAGIKSVQAEQGAW